MPTIDTTPADLQAKLDAAKPGDVLAMRSGEYPGEYTVCNPGLMLLPADGELPVFVGPTKPDSGTKPAWLHIYPNAANTVLNGLTLARAGDITKAKAYNDFGIIIEAPGVTVQDCSLSGMTKGIHVKGAKSTHVTLRNNVIGPTYQSNIVVGTSYGVVRALLIAYNLLERSYIEDAIQFMQNYDLSDALKASDVSNLGAIIYQNTIRDCSENAIDLKGAGLVVIDGNNITHIAGSNNGPLAGWNHSANQSIGKGARASSGYVLIRNNDLQDNCSGIRSQPEWKIIHNLIANNNYSPAGMLWAGYGISNQNGGAGLSVVNNRVYGNLGGDLINMPPAADVHGNRADAGPGEPVTGVVKTDGNLLTVKDAGFFTDWFGRTDLPPDVVYVQGDRYEVAAVDYKANTLRLDRPVQATAGGDVCWQSAKPMVGIVGVEAPPVDPPPVDPPVEGVETVHLTISAEMTASDAASLRALLNDRLYTVKMKYQPVILENMIDSKGNALTFDPDGATQLQPDFSPPREAK
jgi:hypothetical protein